jgi:uncharacterized protein
VGTVGPMRSRRHDPYDEYPPPGYRRRRRRGYGAGGGSSCLRDACLLETGCCIGEAIDNNCLLAGVLLIPQFLAAPLVAATRRRTAAPGERPGVRPLVAAIEVYQRKISANRPACCRFSPSCSHYAVEALRTHGASRGLYLAARRLIRCRPGGRRGPDPVPLPR